jgi:predicted phage terminase large subunit-like protein
VNNVALTPKEYRKLQARVAAEQCRRDMHRYLREVVWPVVEPGVDFVDNWHLHAICEHLKAFLERKIPNLLVNMPPRFSKSILISVTMPTFAWIDWPEMRSIFASYSANLSKRDAIKSRRVIDSPKFQEYYGDRFQLSDDQNEKARYENDKTGFRLSTSVGGLGTGEGGDILGCDDPHNVLQAESDAVREEAWLWWQETMSSRLNNPKKGGKIVVMQRVHEMDVSGHILAEQAQDYCHLMIPMRYEEERVCVTVLGKPDPRTTEGELAWKDRFDEDATQKLERSMGPYAVAGQLQQRPAPRGGSLIPVEKLQILDELPKVSITWVRCWDLAATEDQTGKEPAYTAGVKIGKFKWPGNEFDSFVIADCKRQRLSPKKVRELVKNTAIFDGTAIRIRIPQDPGQAGKSQAQDFIAMLAGWTVVAVTETGSKEQRAEPFAAQVEGGNVWLLRGAWNQEFTAELGMFPAGRYKDQTDATANGFNELIPLVNNAAVLMDYMVQKVAAMQQKEGEVPTINGRPMTPDEIRRNKLLLEIVSNNPNFDRAQGARNVTELGANPIVSYIGRA